MTKQRKEQIQYLLLQYMEGRSTDKERALLSSLLLEEKDDEAWQELMEELFATEPAMENYKEQEWQPMIEELIRQNAEREKRKAPVRHIHYWRRVAVAASVVLAVGLGSYFLFVKKRSSQESVVSSKETHDVAAPNVARATLKLGDGKIVYLDSAANGTLAQQGNINVVKLADGEIKYSQESGVRSQETKYNTISNPRGSKVQTLTLIDGTQVWLNAESSITYPTAFSGNERKVSITGEAYFEVKHNDKMPFTVSANGVDVHDLGTSFNINAYNDEGAIRVTLLEGRVSVEQLSILKSKLLTPGEQAVLIHNSPLTIDHSPDLDEVMAWKNGLFYFDHADLQTVMRQIARWYDVEISYEGSIPKREFGGKISRSSSAAEVLKVLEESNVHYKIEGKKITVMP